MKRKSLLFMLLFALMAPWAANAQNSIPFNEGFESMTSVDDLTAAGWTLSTTESGTFLAIETGASNVYEGSKSLNLDAWDASSSSSVQYLGLPLVAGDLNTLQISFAYKVTSGTINVGYLTDATDFSTFTSLAQYNSSSSFTVVTTDLSEAPRDAARLVLKYTGWYRCYLDSFEVKALPSCQAATSITASDITATSATIAWEGEGNTWNLKYNGIEVNGISAMSYNLTSLTDGTDYTVSVQNVCSDGTTTDWISTSFRTPEICPDGMVCIGEGTTTSTYVPAHNYYKYSLTQQIYTAAEIGEAGAILSIDFFKAATTAMVKDLDIYMVSTTKDEFESTTDFVPVTSSDLVFSGTVTFADNAWTTIELDVPFIYDGTSNVAIMVDNNTGDYLSSTPFYVFNSDKNQALYAQSDGTNFDPFAPSFSSRTAQKNRIRLAIGEPPACPKPTGLTVNYTGGTEATISWTSDATAWNMRVNGTPINGTITNPYTLTGLELATTYEVEVQANCGDATSEWVGPVSFTTDACLPEDMCELTFELTDSFGDGWNGNAIQVVDALTGKVLGSVTIETGSSNTATISVCDGRAINFVWVSGNYASETSYVVYDVNGDEILSGSAGSGMLTNYTVNCTVSSCRKPTDLAATDIFGHSAKLSWTENGEATEWVIDYNGTTLTVNENPYVLEGLVPETAYTVKVKPVCDEEKWSDEITFTTTVACPAPTFEVEAAAESATITIAGEAETYNVRYRTPRGFNYGFEQAEAWTYTDFDPCTVYDGDGGTTYGLNGYTFTNQYYVGACIAFQNGINDNFAAHNGNAFGVMFNSSEGQSNDWFILPELTIERGSVFSFWGREITTQYGAETINVGIYGSTDGTFASYLENGEAISVGTTTWEKYTFDLSEYAGQTIRLAINCVSDDIFGFMFDDIFVGNPEDDTWDYTFTEVNSPYEITGLTPEIEYEVQVQANCGDDGVSAWSASVVFMTKPLCEIPTNVAVADITTNSAVVTWESEATSFDIEVNGEVTEDVTSPYTLNNLDPGTAYSVRVRANCGETGYSAWTTAVDFATSCLAYDLPYEYGFETPNDMNCWSVMAANSANLLGRINITAQEIEGFAAYEGDYGFVFSSYNQADQYAQVLMSPELNSGDAEVAFEFYYRVYGGSSATESVYVLYSITTDDLEEFEMIDAIEATNTDEWLQYQTTLPAGTKYVALYYASNYQYYLFVDGFKFEEAVGVTQTIELSAGWNLISTYLTIEDPVEMLDMLKASLGENATEIQSEDNMTEFDGSEWFGDLDDIGLENEKGYFVNVITDCTVELTGTPANVGDFAINIHNGWNYIGFPSAVAIEVNTALADFEAADGDQIQTDYGVTEYDGEWFGDFEAFEPGYGLMYFSNSDEDKPLVFQTGDAKTRRIIAKLIELKNRTKKTGDGMTKSAPTISIKQIKK